MKRDDDAVRPDQHTGSRCGSRRRTTNSGQKRDDILRVYYQTPRDEHIFGFTSVQHDGDTFVDLLDIIDTVYPDGRGHIIMDNLSAHDTPNVNDWFEEHPRWKRHFTPKHASWLNEMECWFSILGRHVLARGSFTSKEDLAAKVDAYVAWYLKTDRPFHWSYRPKS